jgi:hypothetical protein
MVDHMVDASEPRGRVDVRVGGACLEGEVGAVNAEVQFASPCVSPLYSLYAGNSIAGQCAR